MRLVHAGIALVIRHLARNVLKGRHGEDANAPAALTAAT